RLHIKALRMHQPALFTFIKKYYASAFVIFFLTVILTGCKPNTPSPPAQEPANIPSAKGEHLFADTGLSYVKVFDNNGRVCIQQTSTGYEMAEVYADDKKIPLLIRITKTDLCFADSVNRNKVYQLTANSLPGSKNISWQLKALGTHLTLNDKTNTLLVVHEGDGTEEDLIMRYSMLTGEEVFRCSYNDMKVSIPNSRDRRFIGFLSRETVTNPLKSLNEENLLGLIYYSSNFKRIATLKLKLKRSSVANRISARCPEMVLAPADNNSVTIEDGKGIILMKSGKNYTSKDIGNFSIKFTYYIGDDNEESSITIPVVNDKPDWKNATYDRDIFELSE
ncbi:MAG: hypothetical protein NZM35_11435, partial [Chitinophagales bacterium]|nr:hypothetical protein [Chitinophagales bacterium]MDW8419953.1 hypothetical protein [Chitinophagales bacterium]